MRRHPLLILGAVALLVVTGCAPTPEPEPTASVSPTPTESPTPTPEPIVEPEAAFDVTCDDVTAEMTAIVGAPQGPVEDRLSLVSASAQRPGPAQYIYQRAGGIACSTGDVERNWEVTMVPGAKSVTEGAESRGGWFGEYQACDISEMFDSCVVVVVEGDVLVSADIQDAGLTDASAAQVEEALRRLGVAANSSLHEFELPESEIVGVECTRFLTTDELALQLGTEVFRIEQFGGWDIASEVYEAVNGSRLCYYASGMNEYTSQNYLTITTLPAGAWAFERIEGGADVVVEGADAALTGVDEYGRPVLDLRVGPDWIRLTTVDDSGISDLTPIAEQIVRNFTVGRPAPQ